MNCLKIWKEKKMNHINKITHLMPCSSFPLLDWFTTLKFSHWFLALVQQYTLHLINTPTIKPASIPTINNIHLGTCHVSLTSLLQAVDCYKLLQLSQLIHFNIFGCHVLLVQLHDSFYLYGHSYSLQHLHVFKT